MAASRYSVIYLYNFVELLTSNNTEFFGVVCLVGDSCLTVVIGIYFIFFKSFVVNLCTLLLLQIALMLALKQYMTESPMYLFTKNDKAEFIEGIHYTHGPRAALDSIENLLSINQKENPFFVSYSALLQAELGNFKEAFRLADKYEQVSKSNYPNRHVTLSQIYYEMDSLEIAKSEIEKAIKLDTNHLIAQGLNKTIDDKIMSNEK